MDYSFEKSHQLVHNFKIGILILCTLVRITFKLFIDLFKAVLVIGVSLMNFISSIGGLLFPVIIFITSVEKIFNEDSSSLRIDASKSNTSQTKCLLITDVN
jgi:hypothetical protein